MHTNDCIMDKLSALAGETANEKLLAYYHLGGATSNDLQDAEREYLIIAGEDMTNKHNQEGWVDLIAGEVGAPDTLDYNDLWNWHWCHNVT